MHKFANWFFWVKFPPQSWDQDLWPDICFWEKTVKESTKQGYKGKTKNNKTFVWKIQILVQPYGMF